MNGEVELTAVAPVEERVPVEPAPVAVEETHAENDISPVHDDKETKEEKPVEADIIATAPTNEWTNVESFAGASFINSTQNIANTVIGAGILSIAFSIMKAGVFGSVILIIAVLVPSIMTSYYLSVATIYTNEFIYGDIGTKLCNKTVGICSNITQVLLDFGINVAYMNVFFNQIMDISNELFNLDLTKYKIIISIVASFLILFPLTSIKTMNALTFVSTISLAIVIVFVLACIAMGIKGFGERGWDLYAWPRKTTDLSSAFAVFVLCFGGHINTPKITSELRYNKESSKFKSKASKVTKATIVAYVFCAIVYLFVGICGYLAFGNTIEGSILDSMRNMTVWYKPVVRVGYGVVVMLSYPFLAFPACCTLDSWMFTGERTAARRYGEAFVWVLLTLIVCLAIPSLSSIFGVTGNFCGVLLAFVWPALYFIALCRKEKAKPKDQQVTWFKVKSWEEIIAWVILVVGTIVCIWATSLEVINIVNA